jgi:hypothetical protein
VPSLWHFGVLFAMLFREYGGLGNTPARVDLSPIAPPTENHGKWVGSNQTIVVHCDLSTQELKEPPESWFFGRVAETFFIAGIEGSDRELVAGLRRRRRLREPEGSDDGRRSRRDQLAPSKLSGGRRICLPAEDRAAAVGRRRSSKLSPTYDLVHVLAVIIDLLDCAVLA